MSEARDVSAVRRAPCAHWVKQFRPCRRILNDWHRREERLCKALAVPLSANA